MQALDILLDNAIKHTEHGQVTVAVYVERAGTVCIDVEDTGSGMAAFSLFTLPSGEENPGS